MVKTTYYKHGLHLTPKQMVKLVRGETIRIKHASLHGQHETHLTKTQLNKIAKAHKNKCGINLRMSVKQLHHNKKYSAGGFGSFLRSVASSAVSHLAPVVAKSLGNVVQGAVSGIPVIGAPLSGLAGQATQHLVNVGTNALQGALKGSGLRRRVGRPRKVNYGGSFLPSGY